MSNYYEIVAALVMALAITIFFSSVLRTKGPWGAVWLIFITIFLASWAGYLWITPFGPMVLGVSVAPIFIVGVIFAFILAAVSVPAKRKKMKTEEEKEVDEATIAIGIFFWIVLAILLVAIVSGYYKMSINTQQIVN
ncbi:MAG: hypothetical protein K0S32_963 [Bacteroidetes bacterium]|jgi:hypothetical protein|nr:hypothetical protein [Bacteroidota bacterium]